MTSPMRALTVAGVACAVAFAPGALFAQSAGDGAARQAEQMRRMQQAQSRLQQDLSRATAQNTELTARVATLEAELKQAASARDRLASTQKASDSRVATLKRDADSIEARSAALGTELETARRELLRTGERSTDSERALAAARSQLEQRQATLKAREGELRTAQSAADARGGELQQCREHNAVLAGVSSDLLSAIDRNGLGTSLPGLPSAPGYTRVRVESLIQSYRDKVSDHSALPVAR